MRNDVMVQYAAQLICGSGPCYSCYKCDKKHHKPALLPPIGSDENCPLAKYNVEYDATYVNDRVAVIHADLLCVNCEHCGDIVRTGKRSYRIDWDEESVRAHCYDCPVWQTRECMQEQAAEARVS